jgi:hypothetical protein
MNSELEFQNHLVLAVVQALIGAIRPEVVAVAVSSSLEHGSLDLFVLATEIPEDLRETLAEIETDLDSLLAGAVRIESHLAIGTHRVGSAWAGSKKRSVFARSSS